MTKSMTAFAKKLTQQEGHMITWELRSLNSRYLDIGFHLPELFYELEFSLREVIKKHLKRGKLNCTLRYHNTTQADHHIEIDKQRLKQMLSMREAIHDEFSSTQMPSWLEILQWPGMVYTAPTDMSSTYPLILQAFEETLQQLNIQREREGQKLAATIQQRLMTIIPLIQKAREETPMIITVQRETLLKRFEELKITVDPQRLEQEMVYLIQKMDVTEEIDRLTTHVEEIKRLLTTDEEVGRRLDFLMQELNREANTLGSKSINTSTSQISLELKVLIEQMREQVQNIE